MAFTEADLAGADDVHVDVFHCASMHGTHEQQRAVFERLESLADADRLDRVNREAWTHELTPDADDDWCEHARDAYSRFWSWAHEHDRTLEPAFRTRTVGSMVSEETHQVITFPVVCVAVHVDGCLLEVAPSTDVATDRTYTVEDCLEDLEECLDASLPTATTRRRG